MENFQIRDQVDKDSSQQVRISQEPAVIFGFLNRKHSRGKELIEIQNCRNDVKCSDCMSKENMQEWHMLSFDDYMQLRNSRHCSEQIF